MHKKLFYLSLVLVAGIVVGTLILQTPRNGAVIPEQNGKPIAIFRGVHESGYEGYFSHILYAIKYDSSALSMASSSLANQTVVIKELASGNTHTIGFFYNGGAGFANPQEFWQNVALCGDCGTISVPFTMQEADDAIAFGNDKEEWIIFSEPIGFAVIKMQKSASSEARDAIQNLWLHTEDIASPDKTAIKLYFLNQNACLAMECEEAVPVARLVPKTAQIATAALHALLAGPTESERKDGYLSALPAGSALNSLVIVDGEARADFNAIAESGGGSASMLARTEQIRQTLLQFPTVKTVRISIEGRTEDTFQP
jgi:hypothetical protein